MADVGQDREVASLSDEATAGDGNPPQVVAILRESLPGERRVAVIPDHVTKLTGKALVVKVEKGAGEGAWFTDGVYGDRGAEAVSRDELLAHSQIVLSVNRPDDVTLKQLREGQVLIGLLQPLVNPTLMASLAAQGVTAVSIDGLPRTLSRAQGMDALSSQANIAGYKSAILAASTFDRYFPMLITAAGTAKPAEVLVLGAGVAGLSAMGTVRRLGSQVTGYDIRPETKGEIESVGARYLELKAVASGSGEGGYARVLTEDELRAQQEELNGHIARRDVVITTAQVPGRRPPKLVTAEAIGLMKPGSLIVDLAASPLGGNVEGSIPDETVITENGVTIVGAPNLPSTVPVAASTAFSNNITALLLHLVKDGRVVVDPQDEIQAGVVITHGGEVIHAATRALIDASSKKEVS